MPRPLRIHYPDACYHVMNRGAGRQKIFRNNRHRTIFIDLLKECKTRFNINIYAYCLMENHYHLLLSTPNANLSRVMRHINGVYTQKYNYLMKRDGPLFKGRYLAKLVDEDCYRLLLTRYIHLNPVEARIVVKPADYRWSSYRAYLGLTSKPQWLSVDSIIDQLHVTTSLANIKNYQDYVERKTLDEINAYQASKQSSTIIGPPSFREKSLERVNPEHLDACSTDINRSKALPSITLIRDSVCAFYKINHESLTKCNPGRRNIYKLIFVYLCKNTFGHKLCSITPLTGFKRYESTSAAARKLELELRKSSKLAEEINIIIKVIRKSLLNETNNTSICTNSTPQDNT